MNDDPLLALITAQLVAMDAVVRRNTPGLMWLPRWTAEEFDSAGRAVATTLRAAVSEVLGPYLDELEREIADEIERMRGDAA